MALTLAGRTPIGLSVLGTRRLTGRHRGFEHLLLSTFPGQESRLASMTSSTSCIMLTTGTKGRYGFDLHLLLFTR